MKVTLLTIIFILLGIIFCPVSSIAYQQWYVANLGKDLAGNGSIKNPFQTIQYAIDAAKPGDTVLVMPGRYTGPGNRNLNFRGKAITVQSMVPENNESMRNTILDPEGVGVVIRFIHDEGPDSVFQGFTLFPGDISVPVRGVPGFFEFSDQARPTTRRLRIEDQDSLGKKARIPEVLTEGLIEEAPPYGKRLWDGNNPFHQPAATTNYYGSGDVNMDGALSLADVSLAQEMADGTQNPTIRADVDGNEVINNNDVLLINNSLSGDILPSWWNYLSGREDRASWISKFLKIDQTDKHPYLTSWFVCRHFATQIFLNGAFWRGDIFPTDYNGGQTVFNLPVYYTEVWCGVFGHAINAILIGDNPLNFDNWFFFESQSDYEVKPGMWDMPYGSQVSVRVPHSYCGIYPYSTATTTKVKFSVEETGWSVASWDSELILTRPSPTLEYPDNFLDSWNPRFLPGNELLLFDRIRDDMSRKTDIFLSELPLDDPVIGKALKLSTKYCRLLDVIKAPDGTIHLLWKDKPGYDPGIFHGKLDPETKSVTDITRVCSGASSVRSGRVIVTSTGEIHVFWLRYYYYTTCEGIFWAKWNGSEWNIQQMVDSYEFSRSWYDQRDFCRYLFDVTLADKNKILMVYPQRINENLVFLKLLYDGKWEGPTAIENTGFFPIQTGAGVDLTTDSTGIVHLVYWADYDFDSRDNLYHRVYDGVLWSEPEIVDESGAAACPQMVPGLQGEIFLVWERTVDDQVVPVFNKYRDSVWDIPQALSVRSGADAWYPTAELVSENRLAIAWSSRSSDRVTIEAQIIDVNGSWYVDADSSHAGNGKNWSEAVTSLQEAIDLARDGDAIWVKQGTYYPSSAILLNKAVAIYGGFNGTETQIPQRNWQNNVTTVDGQNIESCFLLTADAVIDGFTVTNGYTEGGGGGIYVDSCSPVIRNSKFLNNNAKMYGGGAVHNWNASSNIENCEFFGNTSIENGGGAIINHDCISIKISKCIFSENNAVQGGAIHNFNSSPTITNCLFYSNTAIDGGAIYNAEASPPVTNCTFSENYANYGGAIFNGLMSLPSITNCILWGDTATTGPEIHSATEPYAVVTHSDIDQDGYYTWGMGNIRTDPLFCFDFHLLAGSPCINAGTNAPSEIPIYDLDGNPRIMDGVVDMGVYEYPGEMLPVIISFTADPCSGEPPLSVSFLCVAKDLDGLIKTYTIDYGDGSEPETNNTGFFNHVYSNFGTFYATCTVVGSDDEVSISEPLKIYINRAPVAVCGEDQIVRDVVTLDASDSYDPDGLIISYEWTLTHWRNPANDRFASGVNPTISDLKAGIYYVELTVTDNDGATSNNYCYLAASGPIKKAGDSEIIELPFSNCLLSGDGKVVAGDAWIGMGSAVVKWTKDEGISIGDVDFFGGDKYFEVTALNYDGSVIIGYESYSGSMGEKCNFGFRWIETEGLERIEINPEFWDVCDWGFLPYDLSADGMIIPGLMGSRYEEFLPWANFFLWKPSEGLVELGNLPGSSGSYGKAISGDGETIAGNAIIGDDDFYCDEVFFKWTQSGGFEELGYGHAADISADGKVIVGTVNDGNGAGFRHTDDGGIEEIGNFTPAKTNGDGSRIVGDAYVWDETEGLQSIQDFLASKGVDLEADGWMIDSVTDISKDGRVFVGTGHNDIGEIIDNSDPDFSSGPSEWIWSSFVPGGYNTSYQYALPGNGSKWARWNFQGDLNAYYRGYYSTYEVSAQWTSLDNRATEAQYVIYQSHWDFQNDREIAIVTVDQTQNGGKFNSLGTFWSELGDFVIVLKDNPSGCVIADAVKVVCLDKGWIARIPVTPSILSIDPSAGSINGGTRVTIYGTYFEDGTMVTFDGTPGTNVFVSETGDRIEVDTPAHASGFVNVTVTNPSNLNDTIENGFCYIIKEISYVHENDATCGGNYPCYTSIQEAIADAVNGQTIHVASGIYKENVALDTPNEISFHCRDFTYLKPSNVWVNGQMIFQNGSTTINMGSFIILISKPQSNN